MNNKPILFVNSISQNTLGYENQNIYDSRKNHISERLRHRMDDITGFLFLQKRVFVTISTINFLYQGEVLNYSFPFLTIDTQYGIKQLSLVEIVEIKIHGLL